MPDISLDGHNMTLSGFFRYFKVTRQSQKHQTRSEKVRQGQTKSDNVWQSQTNVKHIQIPEKNFDTVPRTSDKPTSKM